MHGTERAEVGTPPAAVVVQIEPLVLRLPAAGHVLGGINRQTVSRLIAEDELEAIYVGGTRMVLRESVEAYIERQKQKARAARNGDPRVAIAA
ncbi:helix-turn-helix domain-containing protein [Micromonospora sp. HUAS LYJ1]|uniref:helix-turn-helix domain-containing protein n=1 Tax=Micromonospora sp. HUAS LYJ1 TaxID=3061626 RepID=UPI0026723FED|nr:helix-turn-helix domain-containing protein [Micromonospora sp. HUAS LYJ1]WKU03719.1 helix-turn-helix domain-containing protein [Micromonospora sp. HUAS LYJ1]